MLRAGSLQRGSNGKVNGNDNDNGNNKVNGNITGNINGNINSNSKVKVNNRAPPLRLIQLRCYHSRSDQLRVNRAGQYTVAFFNRSTLFASPYPPSPQAHT